MPLLSTSDIGLSASLRSKLASIGLEVETFDDLLLALVQEATKTPDKEEISSSTLKANARTFGLGGGSAVAAKITDKAFNYSTTASKFTFDASNIQKALPADVAYLSTTVTVGTGRDKSTARQTAGTIDLPETADQVQVEIELLASEGTIRLKKKFPITKNTEGVVALETDDLTAAPADLLVSENLELLNKAVAELQSRK